MKLSHTCSIYHWLWQAVHYFFQQLTDTVTFSVRLLQNIGKSEGKKILLGHNFFFNNICLGQTITDCVSKQGGGEGNSIKI